MLYFFNNSQKDITILRWIIFFFCLLHFSSYASEYGHIWGEEDRRGTWRPSSYEINHEGMTPIKYPEKCEYKSCITLYVSCTNSKSNNSDQKKFRASVSIERHPEHPQEMFHVLRIPSYSTSASIWLNGNKSQASLNRSSLIYSFMYNTSYFWSAYFDAELFDAIPVNEVKLQIESEGQLLKVQAVFDLSKEQEDLQYMKSTCPHPGTAEEETVKKVRKKPFFSTKNLIQK
ncbi:MAG: hypothetical protein OXK80_02720 [Bdellovibrionales bacterium]|nr:hypothetical protein [Bdellovibrionales bacterium]